MTATQEKTSAQTHPKTLFHADGVRTERVEDEAAEASIKARQPGVWFDVPQPPPPPAEPPLTMEEQVEVTKSEVEGLGDQVDAQAQVLANIEERIEALFLSATKATDNDFDERIKTLEQSRAGASGVKQNFQDRLAAVEQALTNSGAAFEKIMERLDKIEKRG